MYEYRICGKNERNGDQVLFYDSFEICSDNVKRADGMAKRRFVRYIEGHVLKDTNELFLQNTETEEIIETFDREKIQSIKQG